MTLERAGACIYSMYATIKEANMASGGHLDEAEGMVYALIVKYQANPATLSEREIHDAASILWSFLLHSFTNIRRFFRDLDPENALSITVPLADGSVIADGSATAE